MGFDGIAIESRTVERAGAESRDWQAGAVELGAIASQLRRISDNLGTGAVEELVVQTGEVTTILRPVTTDYFVALTVSPGGNTGKGRYLLRVVGPKLSAELA
jgi:predicted regulator of Ras-like GTPase activity (Roadblock/LC7/MglB family)